MTRLQLVKVLSLTANKLLNRGHLRLADGTWQLCRFVRDVGAHRPCYECGRPHKGGPCAVPDDAIW